MTNSVKLSSAVEHNGTTYSELTFREPTVSDMMVADSFQGETSRSAAILASMAEVPLPAFRKIKARDLTRIIEATVGLLGESSDATTGA